MADLARECGVIRGGISIVILSAQASVLMLRAVTITVVRHIV
jgi:hypothetical protein